MKITVCELPDETARRETAWADLVRYLRASPTDVVVLPEMPFCEWQMFRTRTVDLAAWRAALAAHDTMLARLGELQTGVVLASRPVELQGKRLNQAFAWTRDGGYRGARAKYYLETSAGSPFLTAEVDFTAVDRARQTYPRNLVIPFVAGHDRSSS